MAKRVIKKATGSKATGRKTAQKKNTGKKPIESYDHNDRKRANNPPVGLVTPGTDPDAGNKQTYEYDPHLDPQKNRVSVIISCGAGGRVAAPPFRRRGH